MEIEDHKAKILIDAGKAVKVENEHIEVPAQKRGRKKVNNE